MSYSKIVAIAILVLFSVWGTSITVEADNENRNESRALLVEMFNNPENYVYIWSPGPGERRFLKLDSVKVQWDNSQETVISASYIRVITPGSKYSTYTCRKFEARYAYKNELKEIYEEYHHEDGTSYWEYQQLVNPDGTISIGDGRRFRHSRTQSRLIGIEDVYYYATRRYFRPESPFNTSSRWKRSTFKDYQDGYRDYLKLHGLNDT